MRVRTATWFPQSPLTVAGWGAAREGAATSIFLASSDEAKNQSGKYWDKCKPKKSSKASYNKEDAKLLWELSEKLCEIKNYFEYWSDDYHHLLPFLQEIIVA